MILTQIKHVTSEQQARDIAIEWSNWQSEEAMSYKEAFLYGEYFRKLANKFPDLEEEFKENGII